MSFSREDKPIVKLFVYKGNYYCYDTFTNRLLKLNKDQYIEAKTVVEIGIGEYLLLDKKSKAYNDIKMLINKGMFKSQFVKEIVHPEIEYVGYYLDRCINDLILQVTQNCNFKCRYCLYASDSKIERHHAKEDMKWETAKKSIDFLYEHSSDSNNISISFYGGEPLLNFQLINDIVCYVENKFFSKNVSFVMTINGSLLNRKVIEFIVKHDFKISISLDGDEKIQNKHRRFFDSGDGTYRNVINNIKELRQYNKEYFDHNVSFLPVVIDDENYEEVLRFYENMGISEDKISPLKANLNGIDYIFNSKEINNSDLHKMGKDSGNINKTSEQNLKRIYDDKSEIPSSWHHNGQCIPGVQRLFIDIRGNFFPCEKIIEDETLSIGNLETGFDLKRINEFLNIGKLSEDECKNCWAMRFCEICMALCNDMDKKTLTRQKKMEACRAQKEITMWFFKKHLNSQEQD